jgi:hypothetical protein
MYQIETYRMTPAFHACWAAAGNHLDRQGDGGIKSWLRASHIKPWRTSDDTEKQDGDNGLLLVPHVDALFDKGLISFADDGSILLSEKLDLAVLQRWGIRYPLNVGPFREGQKKYLRNHRRTYRFGRK